MNFDDKEKNISHNKFVYEEGDIVLKDSICGFCKYNNEENKEVCPKYPNGKPKEIKESKVRCQYLDWDSPINLD